MVQQISYIKKIKYATRNKMLESSKPHFQYKTKALSHKFDSIIIMKRNAKEEKQEGNYEV